MKKHVCFRVIFLGLCIAQSIHTEMPQSPDTNLTQPPTSPLAAKLDIEQTIDFMELSYKEKSLSLELAMLKKQLSARADNMSSFPCFANWSKHLTDGSEAEAASTEKVCASYFEKIRKDIFYLRNEIEKKEQEYMILSEQRAVMLKQLTEANPE